MLRLRMLEVRSRALREGVFGGNHKWLAVYGAIVTVRLVQRMATPKPVVERIVLGPGQSILITDTGAEAGSS